MGKPTGFLEYNRTLPQKREVDVRKTDYKEVDTDLSPDKVQIQAARCMDCGTPFCHSGCPLGNIIPEFNDAVWESNWEYAYQILASTNNFPEFTGRICPAPCESSCVLGINKPPVTIEYIEKSIIEQAFKNGWVKPRQIKTRTGKKIAVIGSGPAGLAAADQLNKAGHSVTVYERADQIGGLLRYGIPDFKLEKTIIDRRLEVMKAEGIVFVVNASVGENISINELNEQFNLILLTCGSTIPRAIGIEGWETYLGKGIYPAMEFLSQQNKRIANIETLKDHQGKGYSHGDIFATDKNVIVIGGGDTGSDCVGTSNRHGAKHITQIEVMPMPTIDDKKEPYFTKRDAVSPWPNWPLTKRTSTSHEEGCERHWSINVKEFIGDGNALTHIKLADISLEIINGKAERVDKNERIVPAELALIAAGFLHTQHEGLVNQLGLELDDRGNVKANNYQTSVPHVFVAGDMRRGQSLVVWAISEGREAALAADKFLMGESKLEAKSKSMFATV